MIRTVHIAIVHPPLDSRIFGRECRSLADAGYDVHFVAREPADGGEGVHLHVSQASTADPQLVGMHNPLRRVWRRFRSVLGAYRTARGLRAEVYHIHEPLLIPAGVALKLAGARVVYDAHEDSPREALALNRGQWVRARALWLTWAFLEGVAAATFDGIVAATPAIASRYPSRKTAVVQNYPDSVELRIDQSVCYQDRAHNVAYVGAIFDLRGAAEMVDAMSHVQSYSDARLVLAGGIRPPRLLDELRTRDGWRQVDYRGFLSRTEVGALLGRARAGLVVLHPAPQFLESQPVKLFEYMAAGLPVIASDFPLWRQILDPVDCAMFVNPLDARAIAAAIDWILLHPDEAEAMGRRGQEAVRTRFNWSFERVKLLELYSNQLSVRSDDD